MLLHRRLNWDSLRGTLPYYLQRRITLGLLWSQTYYLQPCEHTGLYTSTLRASQLQLVLVSAPLLTHLACLANVRREQRQATQAASGGSGTVLPAALGRSATHSEVLA